MRPGDGSPSHRGSICRWTLAFPARACLCNPSAPAVACRSVHGLPQWVSAPVGDWPRRALSPHDCVMEATGQGEPAGGARKALGARSGFPPPPFRRAARTQVTFPAGRKGFGRQIGGPDSKAGNDLYARSRDPKMTGTSDTPSRFSSAHARRIRPMRSSRTGWGEFCFVGVG